jgi:hypothetical protein
MKLKIKAKAVIGLFLKSRSNSGAKNILFAALSKYDLSIVSSGISTKINGENATNGDIPPNL